MFARQGLYQRKGVCIVSSIVVKRPFCKRYIPAEQWSIEGSVTHIVCASDGEIRTEPDSMPAYWFHEAACPECGVSFEFLEPIALEYWEDIEKLYERFQRAMMELEVKEKGIVFS